VILLGYVLVRIERRVSVLTAERSIVNRLLWRLVMHVPWVGGLYRARDLTHVAEQLETLVWAGLPLDKALGDVAAGNVSPAMSAALARLGSAVSRGVPFDSALGREGSRRFPRTFRGLAQLGEQSGSLSDALGQLAEIYRGEALHRACMLMNLGAPLGVCCVGAYVFLICHAFYGTIFGLSLLVNP